MRARQQCTVTLLMPLVSMGLVLSLSSTKLSADEPEATNTRCMAVVTPQSAALGAMIDVSNSAELSHQLAQAAPGSHIVLQSGTYLGQFIIDKSLSITGRPGAIIEAQHQGAALTINASHVTINGLTIKQWGGDLYQKDAAILLHAGSDDVQLLNNQLSGQGFGIYAQQLQRLTICGNRITGDSHTFKLDRGDGVHLQRVDGALISANQIQQVRDGIYLESGKGSQVYGNHMSDMQYGIHYMYTQQDSAMDNQACRVDGGYALMNSTDIHLAHNQVTHAKEFGVLLNMTNGALVEANRMANISAPDAIKGDLFSEGKGIFIYGARDNHIKDNHIANNDVGIAMALGGESNQVSLNRFIDNGTQVRYVGEQSVEWSEQQRGNYWSDYRGWDLNGDGVGDSMHLPNDRLDRLFWLYPEASFLMASPIVTLLKWLDNQIQAVDASGVIDRYPLMENSAAAHTRGAL
ncbi:nitrous oxide reductase family maturation protein NosD [Shewanella algidipiscicola]|uniref:nitrous oxide reductase family maturation protein NosD n=1 Tax=Shewanella algidipiscicola TaxID=614070 RepID=UPI002011F34B|nr:nitrous oxide reductase family maturation protein NosD [Shewanella algidipiscicola]